MTLVAFERFFSIVFPFKKLVTKEIAKVIMVLLLAFCVTIGLAGCMAIGIYHKVHRVFSINANKSQLDNLSNQTQIKLHEIGLITQDKNKVRFFNILNETAANLSNTDEIIFGYRNLNENKILTIANKTLLTDDYVGNILDKKLNLYLKENFLVELFRIDEPNGLKKYYYSFREKEITLNELLASEGFREKRQVDLYDNMTSLWMPTNNCFPNDELISIKFFPYIRLFQNLVVVVCFTLIFVLYAFLCVVVSKRRHLKASRENYYKEILFRSKQNTIMSTLKSEVTISRNNSFLSCLSPNNPSSSIQNNIFPCDPTTNDLPSKNLNTLEETKLKLLSPNDLENKEWIKEHDVRETSLGSPSKNSDLKNMRELSLNSIQSVNNYEICMNTNRNKSTQTKNTSIANIKYSTNRKRSRRSTSEGKNKKSQTIEDFQVRKGFSECYNRDSENNNLFSLNNQTYRLNYNSFIANLKTAFMLFVVTLVMSIVYSPALLTSLGYIEYNPLHWNIIYINNAANPLIYSFLNSKFRKSLKNTFKYFSNWLSKKRRGRGEYEIEKIFITEIYLKKFNF